MQKLPERESITWYGSVSYHLLYKAAMQVMQGDRMKVKREMLMF